LRRGLFLALSRIHVFKSFGPGNIALIFLRFLLLSHLKHSLAAAAASLKAATRAGDKVAVPLNNNDAIYGEIRDLSIERLGAYLQDKAIHIRER
jgi:hypothetical protein